MPHRVALGRSGPVLGRRSQQRRLLLLTGPPQAKLLLLGLRVRSRFQLLRHAGGLPLQVHEAGVERGGRHKRAAIAGPGRVLDQGKGAAQRLGRARGAALLLLQQQPVRLR